MRFPKFLALEKFSFLIKNFRENQLHLGLEYLEMGVK